jgi:CRISPR-associated protein Cmr3
VPRRSVSIGGWNMAKNQPKPMRKAVPAGSVYYFRLENEDYTEKIEKFSILKIF